MPNTSTIVDNFDDNTINTGIWAANFGTVAEVGGKARLVCDTSFNAYATAGAYTWDDVYARLTPPAVGGAVDQAYVQMILYSVTQPAGTDVGFYVDMVDGAFYCVSRTSFFDATAEAIPYDADTHRWFRLLKSGSDILFQTSSHATTWVTRRTLAAPAWLTAATNVRLYFQSHRDSGTNDFAYVDNVNTIPTPAWPAYAAKIDWNNDGAFDGTGEDVTSRALDRRTPITTRGGRDQARALSPCSPGSATLELNNISRDYSPENAASPLAGNVQPGRALVIQGVYDDVTYTLHRGHVDDFDLKPDYAERSVGCTSLDALGQINGNDVSTALYLGVRTGEALGYLLDAAGWPANLREIDPGVSVLPYWWVDGSTALQAALDLVTAEGPTAYLGVNPRTGAIVFKDRHSRLLSDRGSTVQASWRTSGAEPLLSPPAVYEAGWKEIINSVTYEIPLRRREPAVSVVWQTDDPISIAAGDSVTLVARGGSPFQDAIAPVFGVDYTAAGDASATLSRTSGQSTAITLTATGGALVITGLQLRATSISTYATVNVAAQDVTSIAANRVRAPSSDTAPPFVNQHDALAIAQLTIGKRATRTPVVSVSMIARGSPEQASEIFIRQIGDRVHVTEDHSGLAGECFIEQISHTITQGGAEHRTTFGLEKAPDAIANPFRFDTAGSGFNDGRFVGAGYDDPTTMFLFDTAGQGFDQGVFAN